MKKIQKELTKFCKEIYREKHTKEISPLFKVYIHQESVNVYSCLVDNDEVVWDTLEYFLIEKKGDKFKIINPYK